MVENVKRFIRDLEKGNHSRNLYSQIIKGERIKQKKTLQEVATGICSVSYLSKLENREVEPNLEFVRLLLERVEINSDKYEQLNKEYDVGECLNYYYYNNKEMIKSLFTSITLPIFIAQASLIKAIYYLSCGMLKQFKQEVSLLDKVKGTLERDESRALLLIVTEYYVVTNQMHLARELLEESDALFMENISLPYKLLHNDQKAKVAFALGNIQRFNDAYREIVEKYSFSTSVVRFLEKRMMMLVTCLLDNHKEVMKKMDEISRDIELIDGDLTILYYKYYILLLSGKYEDVFIEINENGYYGDCRLLALMGISAMKLKDEEKKKKFLEKAYQFEYEETEEVHKRFIEFLIIMFIDNQGQKLLEYIRETIVPNRDIYIHPLYDEIYDKTFSRSLIRTGKYKEAALYLTKFCLK